MNCSLLRFCPALGSCGNWGQGGYSPFPSKYRILQILVPGSGGVHSPAGVEGTETYLDTEVQELWRLLPKEDILNSSKWLPPQICTARSAGLGSSSGSCSPRRARPPAPECPADRQALAHSCTCPILVHIHHTHSHMLSLTLSWIFESIALWFSCKTGPDLGTSGWI